MVVGAGLSGEAARSGTGYAAPSIPFGARNAVPSAPPGRYGGAEGTRSGRGGGQATFSGSGSAPPSTVAPVICSPVTRLRNTQ